MRREDAPHSSLLKPQAPPHWICTQSGRKFDVLEPRAADVEITDIAHGLAGKFRYGGQSDRWYTVAQHSLEVSLAVERLLNRETLADRLHLERLLQHGTVRYGQETFGREAKRQAALWGLLHDAAEAYLADIQRPIKGLLFFRLEGRGLRREESSNLSPHKPQASSLASFRQVEQRILAAVAERFGLPLPWSAVVTVADNAELRRERRDLFEADQPDWPGVAPAGDDVPRLDTVSPRVAETLFLDRFRELRGGQE